MKKRSFAAFCMRLRMRFLAWRAQRRGELPPDEVFFYRFNQREGLNTRKRAFWAAQAQLVEMGGALPRPARQPYMPAYGAQAYMPACEMTAGARMDGLAQAYMPASEAQAYMPACEMTAGARMDGLAQAYMPASGAQAYMPAYEMTADARMEGLAQAYMPAQAYAVCTRQGRAQPQAFASGDRQGIAQPRMIGRVYTRYKNYL